MNMKKKMTYVCPLSEIVPVKVESLLADASYVDGDDGQGKTPIIDVDPDDPNPPRPGKGWNIDDDDDFGGVNDWDSMWN